MRIAFSCPIRSKVSAEAIPIATSSAAIDAGVSQILCDNFTIGISAKKSAGREVRPIERGSGNLQSRRVPNNCISSINRLMKSR